MLKKPNFKEEKACWKNGFNFVVGIDEAGRGPLAGPVVAGAVCINKNAKISTKEINDSKQLSAKKREELYKIITTHPDIKWGVGIVSEKSPPLMYGNDLRDSEMVEALSELGVSKVTNSS